jgi:hypothetical protein
MSDFTEREDAHLVRERAEHITAICHAQERHPGVAKREALCEAIADLVTVAVRQHLLAPREGASQS